MRFQPRIWYPIAVILVVIDVLAVWPAAAAGEAMHASTHAILAVAFAVWSQRLRRKRYAEATGEVDVQALELEVDDLRRALAEAQERVDFAERVLAQQPERRPDEGH